MPFDGILFDKDGTLVDFDQTWSAATYEALLSLSEGDERLFRALADACLFDPDTRSFDPASPLLDHSPERLAPVWARVLGRRDVKRLAREIVALYRTGAVAGLTPIGRPAELLSRLSGAGLRVGVACNDLEQSVRQQAGLLGLTDHLDFIAGRDSGFGRKPSPGMIVAFAARFNLPPERVAVVGDRLHDLDAARAAGAVAIAVLTGPWLHQDLALYADYIVDSAADVPLLIERLRRRPRSAYG